MKILVFSALFLVSVASTAKSKRLLLSGTVPMKADVKLVSVNGETKIHSNSSAGLKVEIKKRSPASVVTVTAP
ncbi:hypothetical protein QJS83_09980 [Bdellovibrio sp. 22V]|uniref:hypothetical protein n=1 Tax=Bdellovibrio TaxID=958 RepID=UPI002542E1D9|nr:hypothetical protein [Bdellovibrio sp. 22V]WII70788.1 hypothetical protein QJS83_09980 [Bdellovibrio sp. 22V]